jgi:DNA (cytosine-5)-methyltransferase 1
VPRGPSLCASMSFPAPQGVPDSVRFEGCTAACYKQVGNAVPVPLAEALGRELGVVLEQLRG